MTIHNKSIVRLLMLTSLVVGPIISTGSAAQEEERWYRIELLIFAHQSASAKTSEAWEPTPELSYPQMARFLVDPRRVENNLALFDASSAMDALGHQTLTVIPPPREEEEEFNIDEELVSPLSVQDEQTELELEQNPTAPEPVVEEVLPVTPTPFIVLPNAELEFRGKAAYMQRTGRYRTLFHETWVQPVAEENSAVPVIIDRSGDTQEWPELQGSVKIFLSRYLHLETDLWLNTQGQYLSRDWQMPAAPLGPTSLTIIYPPEPEPEPELAAEVEAIESGFFSEPNIDLNEDSESEVTEDLGPAYPWRHAIALRQKRKMRSTEVHYIDHPMLGVVIKISPLNTQALQERAAAEIKLPQPDLEAPNS